MNARSFPAGPGRARRHPVTVWLPLTVLVWAILIPLAVIATPLVLALAPFFRLNPFAAVAALFGILIALCGVRVEVETPDARVNLF